MLVSVVEPLLVSVVEPLLVSVVEPLLVSVVEPLLVSVVEPMLVSAVEPNASARLKRVLNRHSRFQVVLDKIIIVLPANKNHSNRRNLYITLVLALV